MSPNAPQQMSPGRRAAAYWFEDGIPHLVLGAAFLLAVATAAVCMALLTRHRYLRTGLITAAFLPYFLVRVRLVNALKQRLVYPRTGYVTPPEEGPLPEPLTSLHIRPVGKQENVTLFEMRTGMVIFFALITPIQDAPQWFLPALMTALAAILYWLNRRTENPYSPLSVVALASLGLGSYWLNLPADYSNVVCWLIASSWLTGLGAWRLIRYLRTHPAPEPNHEVSA
jgi:hypothetical protein